MPFIELDLIEELFIPAEKQEIIFKLKDAMAALRVENLHRPAEQARELPETHC